MLDDICIGALMVLAVATIGVTAATDLGNSLKTKLKLTDWRSKKTETLSYQPPKQDTPKPTRGKRPTLQEKLREAQRET